MAGCEWIEHLALTLQSLPVFLSCMDERQRSRSRERDDLVQRFFQARGENRGGKAFRRRYRTV